MSEDAIEIRFNQHTKELEEHDRRIADLEKTYSIMQKMDLRISDIEKSVGKIDAKLDKQSEEKGMKWDKLIDYIFYFVVALLLGLLVQKIGLK